MRVKRGMSGTDRFHKSRLARRSINQKGGDCNGSQEEGREEARSQEEGREEEEVTKVR